MHIWNVFLFLRATKEEDVDGQFQNIAYLVSLYAQEGKKMARMNREKRGHRLVLFVKTHRWMSTCKWQNDSFRSLTLTRPIYTCPYIHAHNLLPRTLRSTNCDIIWRGSSFNQKFLQNITVSLSICFILIHDATNLIILFGV